MMQRFVEPQLRAVLTDIGVDSSFQIPFEVPRQDGFGHLSTTASLSLARQLKKSPKQIADDVVARLGSVPFVDSIQVAGPGFINFTFKPEAFHALLIELQDQGADIGRSAVGQGKTVNVEYVSANPTGPLHAGHGRNCAIGDTIANMYEWCGFDVTREYYFNNAGNQMNKLAESVAARVLELRGTPELLPFPEDGYHGEYIREIAGGIGSGAVGQLGDVGSIEELKEMCKKAAEEWCFDSIKKTLNSLGIHHTVYFNEDSLYSDGKVKQTIEDLRSKGLVYEKDGATWLALESLGNKEDKVIVKSTGEPTYRLPDIAYHKDKLLRGFDIVVDIFGADHIATIPDVIAGVKALGFDTDRVKVVIHQMVTFIEDGEVVKFSKRSGKSFTLDELIDEVGADVVRFFFVMRAAGTHLDFDLNLAKEEGDKNPVFYLQYAHARICSVLAKAGRTAKTTQFSQLTHQRELELISLLSRYKSEVERSCLSMEPHTIAEFLRDLATAYHQFYHDCRILGSGADLEDARLALAQVTQNALANGLKMLGVAAHQSM